MARGTPLKWVQEQGGWTTGKMLLDTYGHFMPSESRGYADALSAVRDGPGRPDAAPDRPGAEVAESGVSEVPDFEDIPSSSPSATGPRSPIMHLGRKRRRDV